MTGPISYWSPESHPAGRRARLVLAIVASLVLLAALGVVEVGVLAAVSIVSSGTNRVGGTQ
jgi:hypothetical protein